MLPALPALALSLSPGAGVIATAASAHEIAGNRFFPATLAIDDPGVNDELAMPTIAVTKSGDEPPLKELDISGEYAKRLTDSLAISIAPTWTHLYAPAGPGGKGASGFQNLATEVKYRFYRDPVHELVMSVGLDAEWGGSGATGIDADRFTTYTPTFYFGKGFGDLPADVSWARPLALTGTVGYSVPGSGQSTVIGDNGIAGIAYNPQFLAWGLSLQYSMPYLKSAVYDFGLPDVVNHLIPLVEASFQTPAANFAGTDLKTIGTINPGVIYVSNYYQVGVEAIIPINRDSGRNVGVVAQLHIYLDDLMPTSLGKPLFGGPVAPASPF
ncbi:MAG: hypothetical protein J2P53_15730 [Bradyrhizobiaceae bacterium]|nr:hypothetical protein [Bradyrhizobiaceae bacterium]